MILTDFSKTFLQVPSSGNLSFPVCSHPLLLLLESFLGDMSPLGGMGGHLTSSVPTLDQSLVLFRQVELQLVCVRLSISDHGSMRRHLLLQFISLKLIHCLYKVKLLLVLSKASSLLFSANLQMFIRLLG